MVRERVLMLILDFIDKIEFKLLEYLEGKRVFDLLEMILFLLRYCCSVWLLRPFNFYLYFDYGIAIVGKPDDY